MELHGKVVSPKNRSLDLNGEPTILVNTKNGRITISNSIVNEIGNDVAVGFGYDDQELQGAKAFLYVTEDGCKVGKGGTVSNKWHANKLKEMFLDTISETTRFKLDVNISTPVSYEGQDLYPIAFKEELADLTRKPKQLNMNNEDNVINDDENTQDEVVTTDVETTNEEPATEMHAVTDEEDSSEETTESNDEVTETSDDTDDETTSEEAVEETVEEDSIEDDATETDDESTESEDEATAEHQEEELV